MIRSSDEGTNATQTTTPALLLAMSVAEETPCTVRKDIDLHLQQWEVS